MGRREERLRFFIVNLLAVYKTMIDPHDPQTKAWVERWKQAGPRLDAVWQKELREFKHEEHYEAIDALLELACRFARPRLTSGLVEQQRLFQKLRNERNS